MNFYTPPLLHQLAGVTDSHIYSICTRVGMHTLTLRRCINNFIIIIIVSSFKLIKFIYNAD